MIIDSYKNFLDTFFTEFDKTGIDLNDFDLDHMAYQTSSSKDYEKIKSELTDVATLGNETIFNERRIALFVLKKPIIYKNFQIDIIELIEPEKNTIKESAWEHIEFTYNKSLEDLIQRYPTLKWDKTSLNRERFPMLKLKLNDNIKVKFPRKGRKTQLIEKGFSF